MFWPNTTPSGSASMRSATAARAAVTIDSETTLRSNAPPMLLIDDASASAIAAMTDSGTWVPPGPSRNTPSAAALVSAGNRRRTAATSRARGVTVAGYRSVGSPRRVLMRRLR